MWTTTLPCTLRSVISRNARLKSSSAKLPVMRGFRMPASTSSAISRMLATNKVTEDKESFGGTPAISDGQLILRSDKHLYSVAKE